MPKKLSQGEIILLAAYRLEAENRAPFPVGLLAEKAWVLSPEDFRLKGAEGDHPDNNKVVANLSGARRGLVRAKGWFEKTGGGYVLTKRGRAEARRLLDEPPPESEPTVLETPKERVLLELLDSAAVAYYRERCEASCGWPDAVAFWTNAVDLGWDGGLAEWVVRTGEFVAGLIAATGPAGVLARCRRLVTPADLEFLRKVHEDLLSRFGGRLRAAS